MALYEFMIPRLNGFDIAKRFDHYHGLVRKGVAGFIIFGGRLEELREGISRLQGEAELPLIVCSDLEQGLGQQVEGGTLFPPAMALGEVYSKCPEPVRTAFKQTAEEAAYVGINVILAPVLDINTNPNNPIIATRSFGETADKVTKVAREAIDAFHRVNVRGCGKHFPGHGDTGVDSHISLPVLRKTIEEMESAELVPFREAAMAGIDAIMLGHLSAPAIDPSGTPMSVSAKAISYLRNEIGFRGLTMTDAMNMGGLKSYGPEEAAFRAIEAGADVVLHPVDLEGMAERLDEEVLRFSPAGTRGFRRTLPNVSSEIRPRSARSVSDELAEKSIRLEGSPTKIGNPFVLVLADESGTSVSKDFLRELRRGHPGLRHAVAARADDVRTPPGSDLIIAVFSPVRAWKGGTPAWVREIVEDLNEKASAFVSFGPPYVLDRVRGDAFRIYAWWDGASAQKAAARRLMEATGSGGRC